ncbi:putative integral membrane protein [Phaeoacremonium minimum UCRPA7]|uniref:Putative integral membrane protein n=1 Tax=Phaeoacremonium minimum (strain UCR-PA7) TaxID=1286976 RepID=R8BB38_PHAM7|nr:putative integral membrane protein [Phaeoacremonium minimum UCRPA7]EON96497.1 putative integral membrane protein [Phaeoacremonium minimum UCRPA7]
MNVLACKGLAYSTGAYGAKYFSMTDHEIDGFIICEECYEDWVVGMPFESRFSPYSNQQGEDEKWACDLAVPYIRTAVLEKSKHNSWSEFVKCCTTRMSLPACEGIETQSSHCNWYHPRRQIEGMHVCETCYMDKLALTRFADEFERHQPKEGFEGFMDALGERWTCALSDKAINLSAALGAALYQRNFDVFWEAADSITKLVPCTKHGIVRGKWWTVAGGCPDLNVCEACYHGVLLPSGLDRFFEPAERDPTLDIVCNFCPESQRFVEFVDKFAEALDKGVFSYYADHVKTWAGVPICPGIRSRKEARWWGYPDATFCQDCYLSFIADTPLADAVPIRGMYDERTMICQMWSPRMRKMWLATCEAGPPGSTASEGWLAEFRAFARRRLQIYDATVPRIEMMEGMRLIRMEEAMHQGQLSIMYSGMNSMASLAGTTDGYWHGNSSLGWYETEHGATAANMRNNMAAGMAGANRMEDWMQIAQLKTMWLEVE